MTLLLMRHGETDWNREPARCQGWAEIGINETGRAQARRRGQALAGRGIEVIVTSHLLRARETAEVIREELGDDLPLIVDPRLAETHRGEWETQLFKDIVAEEPETWQQYREHPETFRFPGGEGLADQQRRVLACLRDCAADDRATLLMTHGGSIRLVRCFHEGRGIDAFHETRTANGAVYEIAADSFAARVTAFLSGNG